MPAFTVQGWKRHKTISRPADLLISTTETDSPADAFDQIVQMADAYKDATALTAWIYYWTLRDTSGRRWTNDPAAKGGR